MPSDPVSKTPVPLTRRLFGSSPWNVGAHAVYALLAIVASPQYIRWRLVFACPGGELDAFQRALESNPDSAVLQERVKATQ